MPSLTTCSRDGTENNYRANSERRAYDPKLLRKRLVYRYKLACKCFYPSWTVKIRKRLLWLELR